jgi:hypothetical protein
MAAYCLMQGGDPHTQEHLRGYPGRTRLRFSKIGPPRRRTRRMSSYLHDIDTCGLAI